MPNVERASLEKVLEFANKVREAGGGNPLDALLPAVPADAQQCLIAKNLNFNCHVRQDGENNWVMVVRDEALARSICGALELQYDNNSEEEIVGSGWRHVEIFEILLPLEIGQVAEDFDIFNEQHKLELEHNPKNVEELLALVDESWREVNEIGYINAEGKLVL